MDGKKFSCTTLNSLLCGMKLYMCEKNPEVPNFLDEKDARYSGLRGTRDCVAHTLREEGVGWSVKGTLTRLPN